jgi:hypothetical protein
MFLCVCVILQMLGAPITLLNPSLASDTLGASVLEGFSVPSTFPQLAFSPESVLVSEFRPSVSAPVQTSSLFHRPIRQFHISIHTKAALILNRNAGHIGPFYGLPPLKRVAHLPSPSAGLMVW